MRRKQAGFRGKRSCVDQINTLRIIIEQSVEYTTNLYLLFVDFEKVFDSIFRPKMWEIMKKYGVLTCIINLIKENYESYT